MTSAVRRRLLLTAVILMLPVLANGQAISAVWDPNPSEDQITSYEVCVGTTALSCNVQRVTVSATDTSYPFMPTPGVLYRVAVRAINAEGAGAFSSEVAVSVPSLAQPANRTSTVNVPISPVSLSANDPDGSTLLFTHSGLPFGLSLNATTGVITGTPTSTGTFNVTIFVSDNLETTSRAFVWTVHASDSTAPTLAITSHTTGQTVSTSSITLSGTATDSGVGGNGITSVTVNGTAATGGTASGNNTANWSRSVSLATGANTITVVARDGAGNTRTTQITINRGAALTISSLTGSVPSPQTAGTSITFTATASGGIAPYQFKWFVFNGTAWTTTQTWGSGTYTWTPTAANANYRVGVWARSAGSTDETGAVNLSMPYSITGGASALRLTGLTTNVASPQAAGTTITFTASASGGTAPYQFKWFLWNGTAWTTAQNWGSATYTWTPTTANANYRIGVWARNAGSTDETGAVNLSIGYPITSGGSALQLTGITGNVASPQTAGTSITFTVTANGGTAPYQFKWFVFNGTTWTMVRNWSNDATYTWSPTLSSANYRVGVWARSAGSSDDTGAVNFSIPYQIIP